MESKKYKWETSYTWVLIVNAIYVILFYIIMKSFS